MDYWHFSWWSCGGQCKFKKKILTICVRQLTTGGIACVSYNTLAGPVRERVDRAIEQLARSALLLA